MNRAIIVILFLGFGHSVQAQVNIEEEAIVKETMQEYQRENLEKKIVRAWRIQIITTDDRREMDLANYKFQRLYPHIKYNWEHNAPYYQVKVGAYEKREDLEAFLLEIKKEFPSAIPVQDDIEKKELIDSNG